MSRQRTELSYRKLAIEGASPIGLLVALLDQLISDLRKAASALHKNDIETRCQGLNHASLVLAQLESWIDRENGGDTAQLLARFYAMIRAKMMEASIKKSAEVLEKQIEEILHVRTSWQKLDSDPVSPPAYTPLRPAPAVEMERIPFSQTC
jgi:flagellar secretion chaperone FliS